MSSRNQTAANLADTIVKLQRNQWEKEKRKKAAKCPLCEHEIQNGTKEDEVKAHFVDRHVEEIEAQGLQLGDLVANTLLLLKPRTPGPDQPPASTPHQTTSSDKKIDPTATGTDGGDKQPNKATTSNRAQRKEKERDEKTKRSKARGSTHDVDFHRDTSQKGGKLWNPGDDAATSSRAGLKSSAENPRPSGPTHTNTFDPPAPNFDDVEEMIKQPETRPISQEQLVAEVKGIYAGLVMVESKCIEVDNAQSSTTEGATKLNNDQWQALIALHRTLLHEHHDFFLASQHPSASPALRRLATYSMMALLYETVPTFEDTWIECLGDLGRYRMAIEDDDIKDREVWTAVSRHWYSKASDKAPTTGRLYHHLAILARPNALQQLFFYTKSLCVPIPFLSARESIMTLFEPHLNGSPSRLPEIEAAFVRANGILFSGRNTDQFESSVNEFVENLDFHISRKTKRWMDSGYFIGIALSCAILEYGSEANPIMQAIKPGRGDDADTRMDGTEHLLSQKSSDAARLAARTHNVVLRRFGDPNVIPYFHTTLTFLFHLSHYPSSTAQLQNQIPWKLISLLLNTLSESCTSFETIESEDFPQPDKGTARPLPEDFAQRGLLWADRYYPDDFFTSCKIDDEEKYLEVPSMEQERAERCLWLGCRLAAAGQSLTYSKESRQFGVVSEFEIEITDVPSILEGASGDIEIDDAAASS
ncbi:Telomerase-binding protein EST1A [Colletotrichum sidae]|uniref:Telomerase-binding protein EST1A n=1 Tax=Colletotrichum sidae TaxID=1347389 RepID=A0A4R8TBH6_9PEZI|nr:Telomerase-binding protein EST1A [Colletotrichum sidae]